ncbi:MAG: ABC transporter ATP-binding protein [Bacilli bacterium]|nr:ABC transporter ATP-binding protein [Bacilli bacterium]
METCITVKNLSKKIDNLVIVEDINFTVQKGKFITFLGPSGCGKTTLLRMLAGFEKPTSGKIFFYDKDITNLEAYRRPFNIVFQKYALFPHLNVFDNIAFGLRVKKKKFKIDNNTTIARYLTEAEINKKVLKILKLVDLKELKYRSISSLSGGQQQRVAIARAIINEPDVLLLDEPLSALDLKLRKEMQIELKEMHKKLGITFIYVTHDQEEALSMSDEIIVFNDKKIQQIGTPEQIYNEPKNVFVADFIGESNIYSAKVVGNKEVAFLNWNWKCVDDFPIDENVDVVVRPEDVILLGARKANLIGQIKDKFFKGMFYEYVVYVGKTEVIARNTSDLALNSNVSIKILPQNIHLMKKEHSINVYYNAHIFNNNSVIVSDDLFECDLTQLYDGSYIDNNGFLTTSNGNKYDLINAEVIIKIRLKDIEISDDINNDNIHGEVINAIWKGEYYQILIRSNSGNDYIVDSEYFWNVGDKVSIIVKKENVKIFLKNNISKYEL